MTTLPIDKHSLIKFLSPLSRLGDKGVIRVHGNKMYTLMSSADTNIILYASASFNKNVDTLIRLNVADIKKLLRAIECFDEELIINIKDNHILCETESLNGAYFKYHLVDDSIIKDAPISIEKISKINFDTEFVIQSKKLTEISRGSAYACDTNKIYFYTKENAVYSELTDKEIQNIDSITLKISDSFEGQPIKGMLPLVFEVFRNLTSLRCDSVKVKINNEYKVIMFCVNENNVELKYIVSTLIK